MATLETLSSDQKAELILDPSSGALENATVLKEVFVTIAGSPGDGQLDDFFQTFTVLTAQVSVPYGEPNLIASHIPFGSALGSGSVRGHTLALILSLTELVSLCFQQNITYITNAAVRDVMLNLTLTALIPRFPTFQASQFTLWFEVNLVVLLASVRPESLSVIPMNVSCDSLQAM